jgi:tetratricopeptide (TPR) repeat protein
MKKFIIYLTIALFCLTTGVVYAALDAKTMLEQGIEAFKSGNYGSAELVFKRIKESGEKEYLDRAWFHLSLSIYHGKRYEAALLEFNNFLNECTTDAYAIESRFWLGECHNNLANYSNAAEEYRRFISSSKDTDLVPAAHDRIGGVYLSQKRYAEAILEWEAAISKSGNPEKNALRKLWIGDAFFSNGRYDEALNILTPLLSSDIEAKISSMAKILCGRIYQGKNDHKSALMLFDGIPGGLLAVEPFNEVQFYKAKSYLFLGAVSKARPLLDMFLLGGKNSPLYYDALYENGMIFFKGAEKDSGLTMLEKVRSESTKRELRAAASKTIGNFLLNSQPERAIQYLLEALKEAEADKKGELIVLLGKACIRAKKYDEAFEFFDRYLNENPIDRGRDEVYFLKARVYLEKGNSDAAVAMFETIRKENPFSQFNSESGYYLSLIEFKKGLLDGAIALLRDYLKGKNPEMAYDAQALLAQIYLSKNNFDDAGKAVNVLIRDFLDRKDVEVLLKDYALALRKKGLNAQKFIDLILSKFPDTETAAELMYMFGSEDFDKGNYDAALRYFNGYLAGKYNKEKGDAFYKKLQLLYRLKRYDEVIAAIKKGTFPPMNENQRMEIPLIQARSYYNIKKYDEVYMLLDLKNIGKYPKEDILMYVKCALLVGDYRSAMEAADFLEPFREEYSESLYAIGDYFLKNDNTDQAEMFFTKIASVCPGTKYEDLARVSAGEAQVRNKKYEAAVNILSQAAGKEVQGRKHALLIVCYFEMKLDEKAAALTREHLNDILGDEYAGDIIKYNFNYFYKKRDLIQFEQYSKYLGKYPGNDLLINYLSARIYFEKGIYYKSYNYFNMLIKTDNRYQGEALYHLGLLHLLVNGNATSAINYFTKLAEMQDADQVYRLKAMIHLAIIHKELKNEDKSRAYLKEVLLNKDRGLYYIQADNLSEAFGFAGM